MVAFSQEGEDLILRRIFEGQVGGFYVDVGAHHPSRFSNTFHFYRHGWRGINIDPNPDAVALFRRVRPEDINLCLGVAEVDGSMPYYLFDEPALNTLDATLSEQRQRGTAYRLVGQREVQVRPLAAILSDNVAGRDIDLMTIDVEGFDLQVLRSNDWNRFRPRCLLIESREADLQDLLADPVHAFAVSVHYRLLAKTVSTLIYQDAKV